MHWNLFIHETNSLVPLIIYLFNSIDSYISYRDFIVSLRDLLISLIINHLVEGKRENRGEALLSLDV